MKHKIEDGEYDTILAALKDQRVLEIEKEDGRFNLYEACDRYFRATLTREQLLALAEEIKALAG